MTDQLLDDENMEQMPRAERGHLWVPQPQMHVHWTSVPGSLDYQVGFQQDWALISLPAMTMGDFLKGAIERAPDLSETDVSPRAPGQYL